MLDEALGAGAASILMYLVIKGNVIGDLSTTMGSAEIAKARRMVVNKIVNTMDEI